MPQTPHSWRGLQELAVKPSGCPSQMFIKVVAVVS